MPAILLTGCAGFIGSHLTESLLAKDFSVTGLDNFDPFYPREVKEKNMASFRSHPGFSFYELDICNPSSLSGVRGSFDMVIHLAAKAGVLPSLASPGEYIQVNIAGTQHVVDFIRERKISKYIFASSSSVYGNTAAIPFTEQDPCITPVSPYAFTKRAGELLNYTHYVLYGTDIINLRLFTVYGPRQRPDLAIHKFVKRIRSGQSVTMYGDGSTARDYTYVEDIVAGIVQSVNYLFAHQNVFEFINLGNGKPVKLTDMIHCIARHLGKEVKIEKLPRQMGDLDNTYADITKAQQLISYAPQTSFEQGIEKFIQWYSKPNA